MLIDVEPIKIYSRSINKGNPVDPAGEKERNSALLELANREIFSILE